MANIDILTDMFRPHYPTLQPTANNYILWQQTNEYNNIPWHVNPVNETHVPITHGKVKIAHDAIKKAPHTN